MEPHRVAILGCARFQVNRELGQCGGGVAPAVHGRGAGVAGLAHDAAEHAHAAIDGCDHTERHVEFIQYRALLDMHFNKAQIVARVALEFCYAFNSCLRSIFGG
jgi:hypothetical protein